ncbi:hypothetical protein BV242_09105 [Lactiplantibacillus plantarum]|uniref:Uncharacterized protein n=1 Tax=Lactiplantibacillus plantarum subsp. plantarum TaxID=337330 RepID=A0A2S3U4B6_LACPN|nr:hypothetical protein Lp16_2259 [Lactiplantibacillus plantarum 16]ANI94125.1 hypothetical protein A9F05_00030 [Lactiplantibacillus plantarum]APP12103.1 hypothetical protein BSG92_06815 [Lactiplantibacillus plantarum subsp. plantarum]EMP45566.1 Hypothetical protein H073_00245 [Lactiplantibacillus plantarum UCMA 3037]EPD24389.1 Hypothetical protein L103_07996 [Lactiplantibacillus plantarum IPLA88]
MSGRLMQILLITTLSYQLWIKVWLTKKTNQQVVHNFVDSFFLLVLKMIDVLLPILPNDANDLTSAINEDNVNTNESFV